MQPRIQLLGGVPATVNTPVTFTQKIYFNGGSNSAFFQTGASQATGAPDSGELYYNSVDGLVLQARTGSSYDLSLFNPSSGSFIFMVPTGTQNVFFGGLVNLPPVTDAAPTVGDLYLDATQQNTATQTGASGAPLKGFLDSTFWCTYATGGGQAASVTCTSAGNSTYAFTFSGANTKGTNVLPANWWVVGKMLRIRALLGFTVGASLDNFTIKIMGNTSILWTATTPTSLAALATYYAELDVTIQCVAVGAAGVAEWVSFGKLTLINSATNLATIICLNPDALIGAQNTTTPMTVAFNAGFGVNAGTLLGLFSAANFSEVF